MKKIRFEIIDGEGYRSGLTVRAKDLQDAFAKCRSLLREDDDIVTVDIVIDNE